MPSQNNKKRSRPEQKEWNWEDTILANDDSSLLGEEIKLLLKTRGCSNKEMKGRKSENIEFLKENYTVDLEEAFDKLTCDKLILELKLRGLNFNKDKKDVLVQRLNGEIDATAPPPKKKKKRAAKNKVWVLVYTPAASPDEDTGYKILAVYKSQKRAYKKALDRVIEDIERLYGDKEKKIKSAKDKIAKAESDEKKFETANDELTKAFGGEADDSPYFEVHGSHLFV